MYVCVTLFLVLQRSTFFCESLQKDENSLGSRCTSKRVSDSSAVFLYEKFQSHTYFRIFLRII